MQLRNLRLCDLSSQIAIFSTYPSQIMSVEHSGFELYQPYYPRRTSASTKTATKTTMSDSSWTPQTTRLRPRDNVRSEVKDERSLICTITNTIKSLCELNKKDINLQHKPNVSSNLNVIRQTSCTCI